MSTHDFDWFADRLEPALTRSDVPGKRDWMTNCPVHGGSDSLHVEEKGGKVLVYCFVEGCGANERGKAFGLVVAALEDSMIAPIAVLGSPSQGRAGTPICFRK